MTRSDLFFKRITLTTLEQTDFGEQVEETSEMSRKDKTVVQSRVTVVETMTHGHIPNYN